MMVRGGVEAGRQVALRADGVALSAPPTTVRVVAIGADHAGALHATLREGSPFEDLALDLAIGVVFAAHQQQRRVGVEEARAGQRVGHDRACAGMAWGAGLDLRRRRLAGRAVPVGDAARVARHEAPGAAGGIAQRHRQPTMRDIGARPRLCPGHVRGTSAVAGFAADADLGPGGVVAVACRVIAALQPGRMAGRAHEVPILVAAGPV
jgi:hypothetical protein